MSKNKAPNRKSKDSFRAKRALFARREDLWLEHIANALMEICSPLEPEYIDDSQTIDIKGRLTLWRLGMIAWNFATPDFRKRDEWIVAHGVLFGHNDIPLTKLDIMNLDDVHRQIAVKDVAKLMRRKVELYPMTPFIIENIACPIVNGKPRLLVSICHIIRHLDFRFLEERSPIVLAPEHIREIRKNAGLSQALFAKILEVSTKRVSAWENGKTIPDEEKMEEIKEWENERPNTTKKKRRGPITLKKLTGQRSGIIVYFCCDATITIACNWTEAEPNRLPRYSPRDGLVFSREEDLSTAKMKTMSFEHVQRLIHCIVTWNAGKPLPFVEADYEGATFYYYEFDGGLIIAPDNWE